MQPSIDWEILTRYLADEATEAERGQVTMWLNASPENRQQFSRLQQLWNVSAVEEPVEEPDVDMAWEKISSKINITTEPVLRVSHRAEEPIAQPEEISSQPSETSSWIWKVAAAVLLVLGIGFAFFRPGSTVLNGTEMAYTELVTQPGQPKQITLADGSKIWVNGGSTLKYPKAFDGDERRVFLEGEAYFEVAHNAAKPFRIMADGTMTEVRGTTFNVNAYPNQKAVTVSVLTGKVSLAEAENPKNEVILTKDMTGSFDAESHIVKTVPADLNVLAWKTGILRFENTTLEKVAADLSKFYNKEVTIKDEALNSCHFTGTFEKQPLAEVLEVMHLTLNLEFSEESNTVSVSGSGCK